MRQMLQRAFDARVFPWSREMSMPIRAPFKPLRHRTRGVTLVELMVTIAINLVLVLAATLLFLNTRSTQRAVNDRSAVFETGQFAMGLLSRDITNAGFYPAAAKEPMSTAGVEAKTRFNHDSAAQAMALPAAYANGLFGCVGQAFNPATGACVNHTEARLAGSDALVVSMFTEDSFSLATGQRADCTRADVINDADIAKNNRRAVYLNPPVAPAPGQPASTAAEVRPDLGGLPDAPLVVINAYQLRAQDMVLENGQTVRSASLTCWGNGGRERIELVRGVEQFVVRYGVFDDATRTPSRYLDAAGVTALLPETIDGEVVTAWQRVSSVRVCMMVRSPQNNTSQRDNGGQAVDVADCLGGTYDRDNGSQVRRFEQTISVKNRQGNSIGLRLAAGPTP